MLGERNSPKRIKLSVGCRERLRSERTQSLDMN